MKKLFIGTFVSGLVAFGLGAVAFATGGVSTGANNTGVNNTWVVSTGVSTGVVSTGATGLNCRDLTVSTNATISSNIRTINANWSAIRQKYPRRRPSMIIKSKKQEAKKLNNLNLEVITKLHKEFAEKYAANSTGVSVNQYVDTMVVERAKFFSGIVQRAWSGQQSGLNVFVSDYLTMFRQNKTLRLQNIVLKQNLTNACHGKKSQALVKSLHKLFENYLKQWQKTKEIHQKRLDELYNRINKLKARFGENSDMRRALEQFEYDIQEASDDNEPRD